MDISLVADLKRMTPGHTLKTMKAVLVKSLHGDPLTPVSHT